MKNTTLQGLLAYAIKVAESLHWNGDELPRIGKDGDFYDGSDEENQAIILGDLCLLEGEDEIESLGGAKIRIAVWRIERVHHYDGNRWEPPDWDTKVVIDNIPSPTVAVAKLLTLHVEETIGDVLMSLELEEDYNNESVEFMGDDRLTTEPSI